MVIFDFLVSNLAPIFIGALILQQALLVLVFGCVLRHVRAGAALAARVARLEAAMAQLRDEISI